MTDWATAVEGHLIHLATERGLSENYQISTRYSLERFVTWAGKKRGRNGPAEVDVEDVRAFLAQRMADGLAVASRKLEIIALKIWFRWLLGRGLVRKNPTDDILTPRLDRSLPDTIGEVAMKGLLESIDTSRPLGARDLAMLELLYASGLRVAELTGAKLEHLRLEEGWIRVTGKGNKTRVIPLGSKAREAIEFYLAHERPRLVGKRTGSEVFLSLRGGRLTHQRLWQIVKERARAAGLDETQIHPHSFRHSFATHLLGHGADLRVIQEMLGHANITTTEIYTHIDQTRLGGIVGKFHPRGRKKPEWAD